MSKILKIAKNGLINLSVVLLFLILIVFMGEVLLRVYHYYNYKINILNDANHGLLSKDDKKGWKMSENLLYKNKEKDALNNIHNANIETNKYGFKLFDNQLSDKVKIFFIGDSFTAAMNVSNSEAFYGIIKDTIKNAEVFAYGAGGYGSLQEFMVLDEFIDVIKPNVIIWQFYENDFLDNDYKLDILKSFYNTGVPRPYLNLDGEITYRYVKHGNIFFRLPAPISENIRLLKFLNTTLSKFINRISEKEMLSEVSAQLPNISEELQHSAKITKMIMQMVKRRAGQVPIYLFCITAEQPYYNIIKNICKDLGIHFIGNIPLKLDKYEKEKPFITKAADKLHLNKYGHLIVSEEIIKFLKANGAI